MSRLEVAKRALAEAKVRWSSGDKAEDFDAMVDMFLGMPSTEYQAKAVLDALS